MIITAETILMNSTASTRTNRVQKDSSVAPATTNVWIRAKCAMEWTTVRTGMRVMRASESPPTVVQQTVVTARQFWGLLGSSSTSAPTRMCAYSKNGKRNIFQLFFFIDTVINNNFSDVRFKALKSSKL